MQLVFSNPYHFKYGKKKLNIIGFESQAVDQTLHAVYTSEPVPCFKVQFENSEEIDYIPYELVAKGPWKMIA